MQNTVLMFVYKQVIVHDNVLGDDRYMMATKALVCCIYTWLHCGEAYSRSADTLAAKTLLDPATPCHDSTSADPPSKSPSCWRMRRPRRDGDHAFIKPRLPLADGRLSESKGFTELWPTRRVLPSLHSLYRWPS